MLRPKNHQHLIQIYSSSEYGGLRQPTAFEEVDPDWFSLHRPDAHWAVVSDDDQLLARCSLWWQETPELPFGRVGVVGHYDATDDASATLLLEQACQQLFERGCGFAIGPMNQNTWRDYRFVMGKGRKTETASTSTRPRFFLEPKPSPNGPRQFRRSGFREVAWYFSAIVSDLTIRSRRLESARQRTLEQGFTIRSIRGGELEAELRQIHAIAREAFRDHLYYVAIREQEFLEMYLALRGKVPLDFVLVAEHKGQPIGFVFAVPDLLQAMSGSEVNTIIVKTFGVIPERQHAGLGQILLEEVQHRAAAAGFQQAIHALVRDVPHMRRISGRYAKPFRRYALFGKELSR